MRYRYRDGFEFEADTTQEIADRLRESKFIPDDTIEEWMDGFAKRAKILDGTILRTSSVDEFVEDLFSSGRITAIRD